MKFKRSVIAGALAGVIAAVSNAAAQDADPGLLSLVAGYKAAFTCSATFNAGRPLEQIAGDELTRIYSGYVEPLASLPDAVIDEDKKTVSVTFAEGFAPRVAVWRPYLGCAQLPTGVDASGRTMAPQAKVLDKRKAPEPLPQRLSNDPALAALVERAFDRKTYGDTSETTAILIVKDGAIIAERYRDGFDKDTSQRTWSVAKSIAATIIGAAVHDGLIDVAAPAGLKVWSAPGDPRSEITLENLLHMSSGLTSPTAGNRTDDVYFGGGRVIDHAITNRLVAVPGERWRYANNDTMAAMRALREAMNDDKAYLRFPFKRVLHPLGMRRTFLETDWNGDFILSSQVWTTARDLARLGLLYLNDGVWEGERLLPENWNDYVAAPAPAQPPQPQEGRARPGYGAQFWLYDERHGLPKGPMRRAAIAGSISLLSLSGICWWCVAASTGVRASILMWTALCRMCWPQYRNKHVSDPDLFPPVIWCARSSAWTCGASRTVRRC